MFSTVAGSLAALLYFITGGLLGMRLTRAGIGADWHKSSLLALGSIAVILHGLLIGSVILQPQGLNLGFFNALSFTGWLIAALLMLFAAIRPIENLGIILLPFSAVTIILALLFPSQQLVTEADSWALRLHIMVSVSAYAILAIATVQALLLALQDYRLRHRRPGGIMQRIAPLTTMESLLFQLIAAGFVGLSLALLTGFLFLDDIFAQHLVHKTILSIIAWFIFALLLWGRWRFGWRGRTAVRWTVGGFCALVLAYFGSELVLQLILQRR